MILSVSSELAFPEWHFAIVACNKSAAIEEIYAFQWICLLIPDL